MTVEVAAGVVATGAGVVAAGVGGLPPEPVELPQAATSIASNRTMLIGKARLRFFIPYMFLLIEWSNSAFANMLLLSNTQKVTGRLLWWLDMLIRMKQVMSYAVARCSPVSAASSFCEFQTRGC